MLKPPPAFWFQMVRISTEPRTLKETQFLKETILTLCFCPDLWSSSPSLRPSRSPAGGTIGRHLPCFWWLSPLWAGGFHCKTTTSKHVSVSLYSISSSGSSTRALWSRREARNGSGFRGRAATWRRTSSGASSVGRGCCKRWWWQTLRPGPARSRASGQTSPESSPSRTCPTRTGPPGRCCPRGCWAACERQGGGWVAPGLRQREERDSAGRKEAGTLMMTLWSAWSSRMLSVGYDSICCRMAEAMAGTKASGLRSRSSQRISANISGVISFSVGVEKPRNILFTWCPKSWIQTITN